jgi:hypothetical protein
MSKNVLIGELLLSVITPEQLEEALTYQKEKGGRLGELLLTKFKVITEIDLVKALAEQFGMEYITNLTGMKLDMELIQKFPKHSSDICKYNPYDNIGYYSYNCSVYEFRIIGRYYF